MYKKQLIVLFAAFFAILVIVFAQEYTEKTAQNTESMTESESESVQSLEIYSVEDYLDFAKTVTPQCTYEDWEVILCSDLDFSNYGKQLPIGYMGTDAEPAVFMGKLNGNGHIISGLHVENPEGYAGMFAVLGGVVKNLRIEACTFSGSKCGAIAAQTEEAAIINCYIDAEVEGEKTGSIVATLSGDIMNCVASSDEFYEALRKGGAENCFSLEQADVNVLNQNLMYVSEHFEESALCQWENTETGVSLTTIEAELLQSVKASFNVGGAELELKGYFSENNGKWCVALPATCREKEIFVEAETTKEEVISLKKSSAEQEIAVTLENISFPILFLCADNIDTLYISLANQKDLDYVHENKYEEIPGIVTVVEQDGNIDYAVLEGFYGHGNDSWKEEKKSYNLKFDSYVNLLGMGANEDFALLAGYRRNSLMSYVTTTELVQETGFEYAPEFRLVNVYVCGEYAGVYFLAEKIKIDRNRVDITNVYENTEIINDRPLESFEYQNWISEDSFKQRHYYNVQNNPEDITGGYLLEVDNEDYGEYDSRFVTSRDIGIVLKRARYSSKEQVEYISGFWQDFENALFSENGTNSKGKYYTEYIDLESFAMQWLMYELEQEISLNSSIYYYKESDIDGDGLIHACYPWDIEHSYVLSEYNDQLWHMGENADALNGFWSAFYAHEDFRQEVSRIWNEKFVPAIEQMLGDEPVETESGLRNLNWYRYNMIDMHKLENSRWTSMYPWDRIESIEEFLEIRLETLTEIFAEI